MKKGKKNTRERCVRERVLKRVGGIERDMRYFLFLLFFRWVKKMLVLDGGKIIRQ
jgi:hypothetical protein